MLNKLMEKNKLFPENKENDEQNLKTAPETNESKDSPEKSDFVDNEDEEEHDTTEEKQDITADEPEDKPAENPESGIGEDSEDVIDIDNEEELAKRGLRKIHIEGEDEEEFLMDQEGNIYNLQGDFVGAMNEDENEE